MAKEDKDNEIMRTIKQRERKLVDARYENLVRTNIEKGRFVDTLSKWASQGFSTSRAKTRKLNMT